MDGASGIQLTQDCSVSLASISDLPTIVALIKEFTSYTVYSVGDIDAKALSSFVEEYIVSDQRIKTLLVLRINEVVVGFCAGIINDTHPLFSKVKIASELAWYVTPEHRGHGKLLLDAFQLWAKIMGCKYCTVSDIPSVTDLSKFYESQGFKQTERSYLKVIQ